MDRSEENFLESDGEVQVRYQEIEQKILEVSERLIAIHRDQKYNGMYKNVLQANRRS